MASYYTTVDNVTAMFPLFQTSIPQQRPSTDFIQQLIDDTAAELNAILVRRGFVGLGMTTTLTPNQISQLISPDALNVLEVINRYGAASQLGIVLASFGVNQAKALAESFEKTYLEKKYQLDGRDTKGEPLKSGGRYDKYFNPTARTETAIPALLFQAGGDQPVGVTPQDEGLSNYVGKFTVF